MANPNDDRPGFEQIRQETRQLTLMWGMCCCSPLLYLTVAWLVQRGLIFKGFIPLSPENWRTALISLAVVAVLLQIGHLIIRQRSYRTLKAMITDPAAYMATVTRRAFILIAMSELPVFLGFCLFLLQGSLTPIFGFGIASMLLYAQSHPRSANPMFETDQ